MPTVRYSLQAEADLLGIGEYTMRTWGVSQTARYLDQIESLCEQLAANPLLGSACDEIRDGLRRMPTGKHIVYYSRNTNGILISRILHLSMLPQLHSMEDEPE